MLTKASSDDRAANTAASQLGAADYTMDSHFISINHKLYSAGNLASGVIVACGNCQPYLKRGARGGVVAAGACCGRLRG